MSNKPATVMTTKELEYAFTPEEIRNLGFSIANAIGDMEALEEEKAAFMTDHKEKLKEAKAQVKLLAAKIRTGTELRMIECRLEPDYGAKKVRTYRIDTEELVEERDMTVEERQQFLFQETPEMQGPRQIDLS
jgi:hypothetical protein